jgi:hypothetical protein
MNLPYAQQTTMLKFGSRTKAPNFSVNSSFFAPSNPNQQDYTREDTKSLVFILCSEKNNGFLLDSFWNTSSTFHQVVFSQSTHSNFNCFFLSPTRVFDFLANDVGVHKFGGLVRRFVVGDTFVKSFVCFDYSLLKPTSKCTNSTR